MGQKTNRHTAMIIELGQFKPDQIKENAISDEELREQLKAHLGVCVALGAKVDHENLADLAVTLHQTAGVMSMLANLAEKYSLNEQ